MVTLKAKLAKLRTSTFWQLGKVLKFLYICNTSMLITFDLDRVSYELIFFEIVNYFNPEREGFFTRDQAV
jgi:hypothetical protein